MILEVDERDVREFVDVHRDREVLQCRPRLAVVVGSEASDCPRPVLLPLPRIIIAPMKTIVAFFSQFVHPPLPGHYR